MATLYLSVKFITFNDFFSRFPRELVKIYPAELEIRIKKGVVSANVPQPYFIPVERFREAFEEVQKEVKALESDKIENILVIDTNASIEDMKRYQTYILLTRSNLFYYQDNGRIETISLEKMNDVIINQDFIRKQVSPFIPFFKFFYIIAAPFVLVGSLIFFITSQLVYLLITALILLLGARLLKSPLNYWKAYQIDLHLATIITPFFLLLSALNMKVQFPFLRLIVYTVIGLYILNNLKKLTSVKKRTSRKR